MGRRVAAVNGPCSPSTRADRRSLAIAAALFFRRAGPQAIRPPGRRAAVRRARPGCSSTSAARTTSAGARHPRPIRRRVSASAKVGRRSRSFKRFDLVVEALVPGDAPSNRSPCGSRTRCRRLQGAEHIVDPSHMAAPWRIRSLRALAARVERRAGHGQHLAALLVGQAGGDQRTRAHLGLDHHHGRGQGRR